MTSLRAIRDNGPLVRLEVVCACAALSRWALTILVGLYAIAHAGAAAVGIAALVRMLPAAIATPWLSARVDRSAKRTMLLASLTVRWTALVAMVIAVAATAPLALLLVLAAGYGIADAVHDPAQAALFPAIARTPTELAASSAVWSTLDNAGFLTGSLLVGALTALVDLTAGFAACAIVIGAATVITRGLPPDAPLAPLEAGRAVDELADGARAIARDRELQLLIAVHGATMLIEGACDVLSVVAAVSLLGLGEQGAGWLSAAWGAGAVVGCLALAARFDHRRLLGGLGGGLVLGGVPLIAMAAWPHAAGALAAFAALGVGFGIVEVAVLTLTQRLVAADTLGRVHGAYQVITIAATAAGGVGTSALVSLLGIRGAFIATGVILPLVTIAARSRLRALTPQITPPDARFRRLRELDIFAPLPVATVETIAVRARSETVAAGTVITREGDPGETFYVIDAGTVEVERGGTRLGTQHEGSYFGEIALLHNTRRTATVRAAEQVSVLAIDSEEFLAAVNAYPHSRRAAEHAARTRLATTAPETL